MKWVCDAMPGEEWNGEEPFKNGGCGGEKGAGGEQREGWVRHSGDHRQDDKKRKHEITL